MQQDLMERRMDEFEGELSKKVSGTRRRPLVCGGCRMRQRLFQSQQHWLSLLRF